MRNVRAIRRGGRESERGAAMLMVLLILVVATAIGVLSSYSTSMEVRTAGGVRRAAQAQYLSEQGAMQSFEAYVDQQSLVDAHLDGMRMQGDPTPEREHRFYLSDLTPAVDLEHWPVNPVEPGGGGSPGSLGFIEQSADFEVRFNDGYLDASLVTRERINQLRRRVRVAGRGSLSMQGFAAGSESYFGRTSTQQGILASFSVQAELR